MDFEIEQLKEDFKRLHIGEQKKQFIEKLRQNLQGNESGKYKLFLLKCVKDYNSESNDTLIIDAKELQLSNNIAPASERFMAYFIDVLLNTIIHVVGSIISGIVILGYYYAIGQMGIGHAILTLICQIIYIVIQVRYWKKGTSFGKDKMKLVVINKETGIAFTLGFMFLRGSVGKWISVLTFQLGFILILFDSKR